jgi:N,N'-diacetylchitobiose phosphorylase
MPDSPIRHILTNGSYSVMLTPAGSGWSRRGPLAVTRWRDDPTRDHWGSWIFIRDVASGLSWSAGYQPTARVPSRYEVQFSPHRVTLERSDGEIDSRTEVIVSPEDDAELRRITLTNTSTVARELDVTSYAEIVLIRPDDDRAHPAFFNLFVETSLEAGVLVCKRRPRDFSESPIYAVHLMAAEGEAVGPPQFETDRARFLGRGQTPRTATAAAGAPLSNTTGPVLDPIASWRQRLRIEAGATARILFTTAFAETHEDALAVATKYREAAIFDRLVRQLSPAAEKPEHRFDLAAIGESDAVIANVDRGSQPAGMIHEPAGDWKPDARPAAGTVRAEFSRDRSLTTGGTNGHKESSAGQTAGAGLSFFNGVGGFSPDGSEYVITLEAGQWTPAPWVNVIANPDFGFFVSESGSGCTWRGNSRENRLTPWSNDPVSDPPGEVIYLRDEKSGEVWTPTALPIRGHERYVCRHGQGYSVFEHSSRGIDTELTVFVPIADPVKLSRLRVRNDSASVRILSVTYYAEWVLGVDRIATAQSLRIERDSETGALLAQNPADTDFPGAVAFADIGEGVGHVTTDRLELLGRYGDHAEPAGLRKPVLSDSVGGARVDPCAALETRIELQPGETRELLFQLGEADHREGAIALIRKYRDPAAASLAHEAVIARWNGILGRTQIRTPDAALDLLSNRWLLYQVISGRFWGRTAFYQASGAFGFRDQLQDVMAVMVAAPELARDHIIRCASRQFIEGDVQHWWHPPLGKGVRTRCSDDRLWLPFAIAHYLEVTGDESVLDEGAPFLTAPGVPAGHAEVFQQPETSDESASVDDHCRRAIAVSLAVGAHGLPLIGSCDWNDGFNRVGADGRGESVWLGWFLHATLTRYAPVVERRGDPALALQYREHAERLRNAIEGQSWDGQWYRRAYYDDGTPLGSAPDEECRIDAIAQSWAVLSGAAEPARASRAMAAVDEHLVQRADGLILLLAPPFDHGPKDPGYIKGYLPGIRENGGQYTHAAAWVPMAFAALGDGERTAELLAMLNPINHTDSAEAIDRYKTEPYVLAGDVYSQYPHAGRGGWTWYTGSAGWTSRAILESLLGLRVQRGHFLIEPAVPAAWPSYEIEFRDGETLYEIKVDNPAGTGRSVASVDLDGRPLADRRVPRLGDGQRHKVRVRLS